MPGTLYLVPVPISGQAPTEELAPRVVETVRTLRYFIVENERSARRVLSRMLDDEAMSGSTFAVLDEHTPASALPSLLAPILDGIDGAVVSEAGSPCVADPGAELVALAHGLGIKPVALPGPSSILMALMASGLGGQSFAFRGYLPAEPAAREKALKELERASARDGSTQVFIETPYRNDAIAASAARVLEPTTLFCAALGLSGPDERVVSMAASEWKRALPSLGKVPTVFLVKSRLEPGHVSRAAAGSERHAGNGARGRRPGGPRRPDARGPGPSGASRRPRRPGA